MKQVGYNIEGKKIQNETQENDPQDIQVEVVRRWEVEKMRREQMEKRNGELSKELRLLRQQVKSLSVAQK